MAIDLSNLDVKKIPNKTMINGKQLKIFEFRHRDGSMNTTSKLGMALMAYDSLLSLLPPCYLSLVSGLC